MFPLFETIRFEKGAFNHAGYHYNRMKQSVNNCLGESLKFNPEHVLEQAQQTMKHNNTLYKFRLLYNARDYQWEFVSYKLPAINTLRLFFDNNINYDCKFSNRIHLSRLYQQKSTADDVLIVKNGEITDTSFANVVFFNGRRWLTPKHPLLKGTQRAFLLEKGLIKEAIIKPEEVSKFKNNRIINAMIRFEDAVEVQVK